MISFMQAFSKNFPGLAVKGSSIALIFFTFSFFSLVHAQSEDAPSSSAPSEETSAPNQDTLNPSTLASKDTTNPLVELPLQPDYTNYAKKGSYENETWFSEVPQWHYYDMFGNKLLDGFYLYGLSKNSDNLGAGSRGASNLALHPFFRMWFNGLIQVADLHDDGGIMAMVGDRIRSEFTPFSFNQSLFIGARFDVFYKEQALTFLTNRISNTGVLGALTTANTAVDSGDWLMGGHLRKKFGDVADIGGTWVNVHHEESRNSSNPFSGVDTDTLKGTYTGLTLYGLDFNLKNPKYLAYCEYLNSQEYLDGNFLPKAGMVATLNGHYDIMDKWRAGAELYTIGSRFRTDFTCPAHPFGDATVNTDGSVYTEVGKYQYQLVEDNDDHDEFPENGRSKYQYYTNQTLQGDPDGVIPLAYDKDKNGLWDYEEDFLSYEADPPESKILFDRNNNGAPDEIENDAYPDYPYVPSYYLPNERYYRYNDIDDKWEYKYADSLTQKGLAGYHLYTRYEIISNLLLTVGGVFDKSQEKTFQFIYNDRGKEAGEVYDVEKATSLYLLAHYKKGLAIDQSLTIDNFFRKVQDNIPNHTQGFYLNPSNGAVDFFLIPDKLNYRDMFGNALRGEYNLFKSRGFNYTSVAKFEFQKHTAHIEFNYPDESITFLTLVNKCHYIIPLPFFKDMFLIPKLKNVWESNSSGAIFDSLNALEANFKRNNMINAAYLVCEWKVTEKTALTTGLEYKLFNDFLNSGENYSEPCFRIQLSIKDRYSGLNLILTTGFSWYEYNYKTAGMHNPLNNPHRVADNIDAHDMFIKVHAGF
jgi:hypothetical protein